MIESNRPSSIIHLPKELSVTRIYDEVHFSFAQPNERTPLFSYEWDIPGVIHIPEVSITLRASIRSSAPTWDELSNDVAVFDANELPAKLQVRNRRPGDRISPFGANVTKKLKELLIDAKVPKTLRDRLPVVVSGDEILWVPGIRRSSAAAVQQQTNCFLYLEVEYGEDWQEVFA